MRVRAYARLALAGFRRYSTYRGATFAGIAANVMFGLLRTAVLTAAIAPAGHGGGYDTTATTTYVWLGQGLMAFVVLWGDSTLSDRIRTGNIVVDLYRPWHLQAALFAQDVGRACHAALARLVPPVAVGALFFPFRWPEPGFLALFAVSAALGLVVSFNIRFMINCTAFWLLDNRGLLSVYGVVIPLLSGLAVPLAFLPEWGRDLLWSTPFPAILQAPVDVFLGVGSPWLLLSHQVVSAIGTSALGHLVLRSAVHRVVVQGG